MITPRTDHLIDLALEEDAGLGDVTHKFYPGARHETLNETNRDEVVKDLIAWLDARVGR